MSYFKIDENNEIFYEYEPPKGNGYTFVFVNALTGNTTAWNGVCLLYTSDAADE